MSEGKKKVLIIISGRGSNMTALLEAFAKPDSLAECVCVVSNRADAKGLEAAASFGVETSVVPSKGRERTDFEADLKKCIDMAAPDLICLAGFMRVLSADFLSSLTMPMLNIHPSLLPDFKGLHPQQQALDAGVSEAGCTVHYVVPDVDSGPSLGQKKVPVLPSDTEDSLSARILEQEHLLYPEVVDQLCREGMNNG